MPTSSAEQWPKDRPAYAARMTSGRDTARTERATWVRFVAAVLIGLCALLLPAFAPHVGHTGAVFTDHERTSDNLVVGPTDTPTDAPTDVPTDAPTP